jgi:hypothetical protein
MTLRNQFLALAGRWKLGDGFDAVVKMLPDDRQAPVKERLDALRGASPDSLPERLLRAREREMRRIGRVGKARYGPAWSRLDPKVALWLVQHGRKDH